MTIQRHLKLDVPRLPGESTRDHSWRVREVNGKALAGGLTAGESLARLLKNLAGRVMADVTDCPPLALPSHLARLNDLREIMECAMRHGFVPETEKHLSGKQLMYAATVADYLACLEITRKQHRAPAFVNDRDRQLERIWHGLELIAGMVSEQKGVPVPDVFTNNDLEDER